MRHEPVAAEACYRRALEVDATNVDATLNLATLLSARAEGVEGDIFDLEERAEKRAAADGRAAATTTSTERATGAAKERGQMLPHEGAEAIAATVAATQDADNNGRNKEEKETTLSDGLQLETYELMAKRREAAALFAEAADLWDTSDVRRLVHSLTNQTI